VDPDPHSGECGYGWPERGEVRRPNQEPVEGVTMNPSPQWDGRNDHLKRLPAEYYRGLAFVHWSMTMENRKSGWLTPLFHCQFREILTHAAFRHGFCCPIYCCMPDHFHLLWLGIVSNCDQLLAARYFRKHLNLALETFGARLQRESYDHVLRDEERRQSAFEKTVEYLARNPERKALVPLDSFRNYPYTGTLVPGYPELNLWRPDFWDRFWRAYGYLGQHGLMAGKRRDDS
jgi:putative transposase